MICKSYSVSVLSCTNWPQRMTGVSEHLYTVPLLSPLPSVNKHLTSFLDNSLYSL